MAELPGQIGGARARGQHVVATKSGHYIQATEPDLVIAAVRQVVEADRQWSSLRIVAADLSEEFCSTGEDRPALALIGNFDVSGRLSANTPKSKLMFACGLSFLPAGHSALT